jgi:hypothetical protein
MATAAASAAHATAAPAPKAAPTPKAAADRGISLDDIRVVKGLVARIGAGKLRELAGMLAR